MPDRRPVTRSLRRSAFMLFSSAVHAMVEGPVNRTEFVRCVAHFAVDDHEVRFCTRLKDKGSWFLPFNHGWNDDAGSPSATCRRRSTNSSTL